jgi:acyl-CoA synthetase (AMP-forming)/AMP-acid ligase II
MGQPATVKALVEDKARARGTRPLFRWKGRAHSHAETNAGANRLAHGLAEVGVHPGDRVATMLPNRPEFLSVWFAVAKLGAVLVPLNPLLRKEALTYSVQDSGAQVVVFDDATMANVEEVRGKLDVGRFLAADAAPAWATSLADARSARTHDPDVDVQPGDVMCILYTSGTTGMPKGVMLPHYSYVNTGREFAALTALTERDRPFTNLPLFHVNAQQTTAMGSMLGDVEFVLEGKFSAGAFWGQVRESGATIFNYIGSIIPVLSKAPPSPQDRDHHLRLGVGAACPKDLWEPFEQRFGLKLMEGYGLTETGTVATCNRPGAVRVGSVGQAVRFAEVQVVDALDRPLPPGEVGEIVVRPREAFSMMLGYWQRPEATVQAWRNLWFHTGDLGRRDEDGFFYFVDRAKDCIRRRGENISSFLIQKTVLNHPAVLDCAAYGVPSEFRDGEDDVKVDLVLKPGQGLTPEAFIGFCRGHLAEFMVPRYVEFRAELPRTETERVQKFKLRAAGVASAWDRLAHEPRPR